MSEFKSLSRDRGPRLSGSVSSVGISPGITVGAKCKHRGIIEKKINSIHSNDAGSGKKISAALGLALCSAQNLIGLFLPVAEAASSIN